MQAINVTAPVQPGLFPIQNADEMKMAAVSCHNAGTQHQSYIIVGYGA